MYVGRAGKLEKANRRSRGSLSSLPGENPKIKLNCTCPCLKLSSLSRSPGLAAVWLVCHMDGGYGRRSGSGYGMWYLRWEYVWQCPQNLARRKAGQPAQPAINHNIFRCLHKCFFDPSFSDQIRDVKYGRMRLRGCRVTNRSHVKN